MSVSFRQESARLVAALTRLFGARNLALAEDVAQDTLLRAFEVWKLGGEPADPSAWLVAAARNRALDLLRRDRTARTRAPELARMLESEWTLRPAVDASFEPGVVADEELRLMFSCCDPGLAEEVQIALVLNISCGFSAKEVAEGFLESTAAIEKRLSRGKKLLAACGELFDLRGPQLEERLPAVERAIYLLFNEGYQGSAIRGELCREALRLSTRLLEHPTTAAPHAFALAALLHLHAARLPARLDAGELQNLRAQDRSRWDKALVTRGFGLLDQSADGDALSEYHVEAAIAALHAAAPTMAQTNWARIVELYDVLLRLRPSPVVELNRAIAVAQLRGPAQGLAELERIEAPERLARYPFFPAARAELLAQLGRADEASALLAEAMRLSRSEPERHYFERRGKLR